MPAIAVVGSLNMDLVVQVPRFPGSGETLARHDFHTIPGGKGANQAVAASRQGADVTMIGRVGADGFGETLRSNLMQDGINIRHVITDPDAPTGVALIGVEDSEENRIIIVAGANGQVTPQDVDHAEADIAMAEVLLLQLEVPIPAVARAVELAHENNVTVILNPAPAQELPESLLSRVDYLIPNEGEAALLTGQALAAPLDAAKTLRSAGVKNVIVTLGDQGALLVTDQLTEQIQGFPISAVDTTAAGDSFVAGFAAALASGMPADQAVRWGNASGALAATILGAQPSLPTYETVQQFISSHDT